MANSTKDIIEKIRKDIKEKYGSDLSLIDEMELNKNDINIQNLCQKEGWLIVANNQTKKRICPLPDGYQYEENTEKGLLPEIVLSKKVPMEKDIFKGLKEKKILIFCQD